MSRVRKPGNKFMNAAHYDSSVTGPSKTVRIHCEEEKRSLSLSGG